MNFSPEKTKKTNDWCRTRKKLGATFLLVGVCFIFNPEIMLVDLLPDFIGYAFLLLGLYQLADLSPKLTEAFKGFRRLMFVSLAQLMILYLLAFRISQNEQPTGFLLWVFIFLILNLLFGLPAWGNFFDGLLYLGLRHEGQALLGHPGKKGKRRSSVTVALQRFTYVFLILKSLFPLLAEWSVLSMYDHQEDYRVRNWYQFVDLYRGLVILFGVIIGTVWLVMMIRYLKRFLRDDGFWERVEALYAGTVLPDEGLFVKRRVRWGFLTLIAGVALSTEFYLDEINLIPEWCAPVVILAGVLILYRDTAGRLPLFLSLGSYAASGILLGIFNRSFYEKFKTIGAVTTDQAAASAQTVLCVLTVVERALFLVTLYFLFRSLCTLIATRTGFPPKCEGMPDRTEEIRHGEKLRLFLAFIPGGLAAAASICYRILLPISDLGSLWIVQVLFSVALCCYLGYVFSYIGDQVERRFLFMGPDASETE